MARRRDDALSAADSAWWHMERPTNQMVITGVLSFEDPLSYPQVQELFRTRFLRYRRFRQRLQRPRWPLGRLRWVDDESFSLENHLHLAHLPPPADRTAMQDLVSELMSESLDPARPLWQKRTNSTTSRWNRPGPSRSTSSFRKPISTTAI